MCLTQFLGQYGMPLIAICLTLAALGFSIFGTIYSNLVHSAEMAEGNALQSKGKPFQYWGNLSCTLRNLVRSRAYSANLCYLSLLLTIVSLVLLLFSAPNFTHTLRMGFCIGTFKVAVALLFAALFVAAFYSGYKKSIKLEIKRHGKLCKCLLKLLRLFWPVNPDPRLTKDC
jgi:hypothetical protein